MQGNEIDWSELWRGAPVDVAGILREQETPRWHHIESFVRGRFGGFLNLKVIEVGSGRGTNAFQFARRGATAVLLDRSAEALYGATEISERLRVPMHTVQSDLFDPPKELLGAFDISCSFGLCEHFTGENRTRVIRAHADFLRPGGVAIIGVPNRWAAPYRLWMWLLKKRGHWLLGTEIPFGRPELVRRLAEAGGRVVKTGFGSFASTTVQFLVNPLFHDAGRQGFIPPQWKTPLDFMAYELVAIAEF